MPHLRDEFYGEVLSSARAILTVRSEIGPCRFPSQRYVSFAKFGRTNEAAAAPGNDNPFIVPVRLEPTAKRANRALRTSAAEETS